MPKRSCTARNTWWWRATTPLNIRLVIVCTESHGTSVPRWRCTLRRRSLHSIGSSRIGKLPATAAWRSDRVFMLLFDAHLDLAMNAMEWNRDLSRPVQELRERERGLTDKPDRGNSTV